jgi:hypothetical protein
MKYVRVTKRSKNPSRIEYNIPNRPSGITGKLILLICIYFMDSLFNPCDTEECIVKYIYVLLFEVQLKFIFLHSQVSKQTINCIDNVRNS